MSDNDMIRRGDAIAVCRHAADAERAADHIAALPAVTVGVRPLVWEDFDGLGAKASAFYQANYLIQWWKGEGKFEVALSYPGYQTGYDGERWHPTLEAAKAAAQADYEARFLAMLDLTPATDAAAIREAALREAMAACLQAETDWNAIAYEKRQVGKDDNFACASASASRKNANAILALIGQKGGA